MELRVVQGSQYLHLVSEDSDYSDIPAASSGDYPDRHFR
jgi:hypothetical protein